VRRLVFLVILLLSSLLLLRYLLPDLGEDEEVDEEEAGRTFQSVLITAEDFVDEAGRLPSFRSQSHRPRPVYDYDFREEEELDDVHNSPMGPKESSSQVNQLEKLFTSLTFHRNRQKGTIKNRNRNFILCFFIYNVTNEYLENVKSTYKNILVKTPIDDLISALMTIASWPCSRGN